MAIPPLYAAFLMFCAAAHGDPALTRAAVEKEGGHAAAKVDETPSGPISWDVEFHGRSMNVIASSSVTPPEHGMPALGIADCIITIEGTDEASAAPIAAWAGVPSAAQGDMSIGLYEYREIGGRHVALQWHNASERMKVEYEEHWQLGSINGGIMAQVHYTHVWRPH